MRQLSKDRDPGLAAVLKEARSLQRLADLLTAAGVPITMSAVAQWHRVPSGRCLDVERVTGVSRYVLRPDIYGEEPGRKAHAKRSASRQETSRVA